MLVVKGKLIGEEQKNYDTASYVLVEKLENLRKQLLSYVQPRLAWEVTLLEIGMTD